MARVRSDEPAVGEDELELALEPLAPHRRNGVLDVALLVEHRRQDAHVDGHAGPPVRNDARAPASASVVCACAITVPASTNLVRSPSSSSSRRSASATACASPGATRSAPSPASAATPPDVSGHCGQTRGERLDQHLGHALRPRDVQKGVGAVVGIAKPGVDSDVSAQGDHVLQTELRDPAGELALERPLSVHVEPPRRVTVPVGGQARHRLGEQERVLLGVEAANGEDAAGEDRPLRRILRPDVGLGDERDVKRL